MKSYLVLTILLSTILFSIDALPARNNVKDDVEIVPLPNQFGFGGSPIVDTGVIGSDSSYNPFDGLFESLEAMMTRLRNQMNYLLRGIERNNGTDEFSSIPGFHFPQIDLGKGNTTSVTKIIDGHKVVINETEYKQEGDLGGSFFKVRIINVEPDSLEISTEKDSEAIGSSTRDREFVENTYENEIPKNKEIEEIENFKQMDNLMKYKKITKYSTQTENYYQNNRNYFDWNNVKNFDENNDIETINQAPIDLNRDTYVNQIMMDAGVPTNPDAEIFDVNYGPNYP